MDDSDSRGRGLYAEVSQDGAEERVARASLPDSNAVSHPEGESLLALTKQKEGLEQRGGADHGRRSRHRSTPGQGVCQAGSQKGRVNFQSTNTPTLQKTHVL